MRYFLLPTARDSRKALGASVGFRIRHPRHHIITLARQNSPQLVYLDYVNSPYLNLHHSSLNASIMATTEALVTAIRVLEKSAIG